MNLRESVASTHHANLAWSPEHERAIDKVAALGLADELGVLLWKAKYMSESWAYVKARRILINLHSNRFPNEARLIVDAVVEQCLHEYVSDMCQWCKGAKEIIANEKRVVCDACNGSGVKKYTDFERAKTMKVATGKVQKMIRQFESLHRIIRNQDSHVNGVVIEQLER